MPLCPQNLPSALKQNETKAFVFQRKKKPKGCLCGCTCLFTYLVSSFPGNQYDYLPLDIVSRQHTSWANSGEFSLSLWYLAPASSGSLQPSINIRIMLTTGKLSKGYVYTLSFSWDFTTRSKEPSAEATTVSLKAAGWVFLCHANRAEQIYS